MNWCLAPVDGTGKTRNLSFYPPMGFRLVLKTLMPAHLQPPIPFSLSLFGDHVRFLKGAVAGFVTLHDIPVASKPKAIGHDQQLQSLSYYHGASLARLLRDVEGGEYREHVATLRSWGEGETVALTDFSRALDTFEKELSRSPRELEHELKKPPARTQSSLHLPSALLAFLGGECEIDHHGSVFYANGLAVDPLLDLPPMPEVFEYFESAIEGGSALRIPSLDLNVYAPPEIELRDLSAFYACLRKPGLAFYLVEKILYVIPRDENHAHLLPKIEDIRKAGLISEVSLLPVIDQDSKPVPQVIGPVAWDDTGDLGKLDLRLLSQAAKARWIRGENAPDTQTFAELPILREWLLRHGSLLHWSDCRKLKKILETLGFQGHGGQWTTAGLEAMQDQIQGILGELHHREEVLARYRSAWEEHPDLILLVEGEIRTPDGKMTSDALIGLLDAGKRELDLWYVFEITTTERSRESNEEKHSANLNRRFPEKGLASSIPKASGAECA